MAITADDYNNIRNKIVAVLGTGATGYGQTLVSSAATSTSVISSTLWNNLRTDMKKARTHQTGRDEDPYAPATLNRTSLISESVRAAFDAYADNIVTDQRRLAFSPLSDDTIDQAQKETFFTSTGYPSNWNSTLYYRAKIKFADNNQARYFFNAGGEIRFYASKSTTTALSKDQEWSNIIGTSTTKDGTAGSGFGIVAYKYNSVGQYTYTGNTFVDTSPVNFVSYSTLGTSYPAYSFYTSASGYTNSNLPTTATTIFSKSASSYGSNIYDIRMYADSAASPTELTFLIRFQDLAVGGTDEQNSPIITQYVDILRPYIPGGVIVSGPSLALSSQNGVQLAALT